MYFIRLIGTKFRVHANILSFPLQRYMSPEVAAHEPYNQGADVYSFGIVLCEILFLRNPISTDKCGLIDMIHLLDGNLLPESIMSIILSCLSPVIRNRPKMKDVQEKIRVSILQLVT
jgi:serine/threonine protein kinase